MKALRTIQATTIILLLTNNTLLAQSKNEDTDTNQHITPILKSESGRYAFGQISTHRRDQYLLDTKTGRLWQIVQQKDGALLLQPIPICQITVDTVAYTPEPEAIAEKYRQMATQNEIERTLKELESTKKNK